MIKYRPAVHALIPPISALYHVRVRCATFVHFKVLCLWTLTEWTETDSECLMSRHLSVQPKRHVPFFPSSRAPVVALMSAIYLITSIPLTTRHNQTHLAVHAVCSYGSIACSAYLDVV